MKKIILFIFLAFSLIGFEAFSQEASVATYAKIIAKEKSDTSVVKSYERLANIFSNTNPDTVLYLSKKALNLISIKLPGAKDKSKFILQKIKADLYSYQAHIYYYRGDPERCLELLNNSYIIYQKIRYMPGLSSSLNDLGFIYDKQGNVEKALKYTLKALEIIDMNSNMSQYASALNNIAIYYDKLGDIEKALESHNKSLSLRKELGNKEGIANSLTNIAAIHRKLGEDKKAIEYLKHAIRLQEDVNHMQGKVKSLISISGIYESNGEAQESFLASKEALQIARELGYPESIRDASIVLVKAEKQMGLMDSALAHYKLHIIMKDSINTHEMEKWEAEREIKSKTATEMLVLEEEKKTREALSQKEKERGELILYAVAIVLLLVLGFVILMVNRFRRARENKNLIEEQKKQVEEHKKEITDSIYYAENIQRAILPSEESLAKMPSHFLFFKPKDIVSGDFYWMTEKEGRVYFAACDCTGHGVPGAFMSMLNSALLTEAVNEKNCTRPCDIFYEVRKGIIDSLKQTGEVGSQKDGMDAALCSWNKNGTLEYALANTPLFLIRNGELTETKGDKLPVGILTGEQIPFTHHELKVEKGDTVYIFSDGFPDQFGGPKQKKFMIKRFKQLLLDIHQQPLEAQRDKLDTTIEDWMDEEEQVDDILVVGMRF